MKINVSGHHCDITESVKDDINQKLSKIASHFPTLISLDIIVTTSSRSVWGLLPGSTPCRY